MPEAQTKDIEYPAMAFSSNPVTGEFICVKPNESGYWSTTIYTPGHCREMNRRLGVTEEIRLAMDHGSMFGWDTPGADPEHKLNKSMANSNRKSGEALGV